MRRKRSNTAAHPLAYVLPLSLSNLFVLGRVRNVMFASWRRRTCSNAHLKVLVCRIDLDGCAIRRQVAMVCVCCSTMYKKNYYSQNDLPIIKDRKLLLSHQSSSSTRSGNNQSLSKLFANRSCWMVRCITLSLSINRLSCYGQMKQDKQYDWMFKRHLPRVNLMIWLVLTYLYEATMYC